MPVTRAELDGESGMLERLLRSLVVGAGLVAMGAGFVLDYQGFSRPICATILFSGVVLFSSGVSGSLLRSSRHAETRRDRLQINWYGRLGVMPLAALLVSLFVSRDVWAAVSGEGKADYVFLAVAGALTVSSFLELTLFRLRPLLDEELTRVYASSAMAWGFVGGFIGAGVVLALMVIDHRIGVMALMPMMAISVWVAGLRLFWLMGQADRE